MDAVAPRVGCLEAATEILGDKWTPLLLRHFINEEVVRFCQLQDLTHNINPRTLSARLSTLEEAGVIEKLARTGAGRCEYRLTPKGRDLLPILQDMEAWGRKHALGKL